MDDVFVFFMKLLVDEASPNNDSRGDVSCLSFGNSSVPFVTSIYTGKTPLPRILVVSLFEFISIDLAVNRLISESLAYTSVLSILLHLCTFRAKAYFLRY